MRRGTTTTFATTVYDPTSRHVLEESRGSNAQSFVLDATRDRILATVGAGSAVADTYVYQNLRGDVRAVVGADGNAADIRHYLPTGTAIGYDTTDFPDVRYAFQGKEVQSTGLADFVNRAHDPRTGRFGGFDPMREGDGLLVEPSGGAGGLELDIPLIQSDYNLGMRNNLRAKDIDGLYHIRESGRQGCSKSITSAGRTEYVYVYKAMQAMRYAYNNASCISNAGGSNGLRTRFQKAYDRVDIRCRDKYQHGRCGLNLVDNINLPPMYQALGTCGWRASSAGLTKGTLSGNQVVYNWMMFHELMHEADPAGAPTRGGLEHRIIDRCQKTCGTKALGYSYYTLGADGDSGSTATAACTYTGNYDGK